ncbi:MAG: DNA mismatch repair endonuclease MutL [Tissierellaceae bacterium]|nr:DNA mismatch repair endonuclease MutL [Tissierellaceae bacterium]
MNRIKLLKNETIEKIAAGEVIERPSSIVKELVENSLDANADDITIEIKAGGKTYIRVTDNGDGINEEDLELAFKRHSTSKLSTIEDLYKIKSLGFRGEALSSISHVAKVEVMTKVGNAISGIQSFFEEGEIVSKEIVGCQKGTTMIIRDLFYNLPVRKKFLKSDIAESNHISDMVYKIALGNPGVSFKFIKDNKIILRTSKNNHIKSHIYSVLGKEFSNNLTEINQEENGIRIKGYISNNELYRGNRNHQYLYINGRFIKNHIISYTIEKFYKSIIPLNRFPCFIVFLDISPGSIDVNIHPTKEEVKFSNQEDVILVLEGAVKNALYPSITIPKMKIDKNRSKEEEESIPLLFELENLGLENINMEKNFIVKDFTTNRNSNIESIEEYNEENVILEEDKRIEDKSILDNLVLNGKIVGVIFGTYIIMENPIEEKIYLIDQHAAHERVMYEKYLLEYRNDSIHSQQLITPEILQLTNHEMNIYNKNSNLFNKLGFEVEPFGNNSVAIRAVPLIFGHPNLKDLFFDLLDNIDEVKTSYDTRLEKIMKIACTKAIKSGDIIGKTEIFGLIKQLGKTENPNSCPHGRPTIMAVDKKDIEKAFLRII